MKCDNQSVSKMSKNFVFHAQTKHIEAQYQLVREKLEDGTFEIGHVQSRLQLVDMLTKP
jgi:hypothetical protein